MSASRPDADKEFGVVALSRGALCVGLGIVLGLAGCHRPDSQRVATAPVAGEGVRANSAQHLADQSAGGFSPASSFVSELQRPRSTNDLLKNLKVIWERKLLLKNEFFSDDVLLAAFNAKTITWEQPPKDEDPHAFQRHGSLTTELDDAANLKITLFRSHQSLKQDKGDNTLANTYFRDTGAVEITVTDLPEFSWQSVTDIFGSNATDLGAYPVGEGMTSSAPTRGDYYMCFVDPDERPDLPVALKSVAAFLVKHTSWHSAYDMSDAASPRRHPRPLDVVTSVKLIENTEKHQ